ncbi:Bll2902 protein [hydrothermal vent metagenome]|uniref:Bll2902 protein n=1 Tax=hydrothermal vent metagenome TaxID=652676 RepID=A0A3B0TR10_9ZZZZ
MSATTKRFMFVGSNGDELAGRLDLPSTTPKAHALFAHCFTCTKDIFAANRISEGLVAAGIGVLRFDFTGLGASEGEFANTNFTSNTDDLVAAADHMRKTLGTAPIILIGHSLGGAAVLAAAEKIPEVTAVVTIGAPSDPAHVANIFQCALDEIEENGEAEVLLAGRPFVIQKQFVDDISGQNLLKKVARLKRALLVMHAPTDKIVGIENASEIFQAAKHPKSFISLDSADHLLSKREDAAYVAGVIAAWVSRYLNKVAAKEFAAPGPVAGTVVVAETGSGKFANYVVTGSGHVISADEPLSVGGTDSGPSPYDLLLAALGACKSMTMRMYAMRKGYDLKRIEVRLAHDKIHAKHGADCENKSSRIDRIKTEISISGQMSEQERKKVFEIAERCPVHRTITSDIIIEAELVE